MSQILQRTGFSLAYLHPGYSHTLDDLVGLDLFFGGGAGSRATRSALAGCAGAAARTGAFGTSLLCLMSKYCAMVAALSAALFSCSYVDVKVETTG